jgi:queuine/archaeosine tRNA-ribosyltransferase
LPDESLRIAPGCWSPEAVWQLVKLGIDVFDTSLPLIVTDRGSAFTFNFNPDTER